MSFDAARPGTDAAAWDDVVATATPFDLEPFSELLVIAAHPDDETLGAAGLISWFGDRGRRVRVVVVTDGAASHPGSRSHSPDDLVALRAIETRRALAELAPAAELEFLGFPDGATREHAAPIADALGAAVAASSATALIAAPWHGDGHRDHRVVSELTASDLGNRAFVEYPIWMWHWGIPGQEYLPALHSIPVDRARKTAAIARHISQVTPLSHAPEDRAMLSPEFLEHFDRDVEVVIESEHSLGAAYFDALYARRDDPWRLATRWYEERKRAITVASLPERRYARALEIGSSIGMLTAMLQERADELVTLDISDAAVTATRARVGGNVTVLKADATEGLPDGVFDLVVISEVGYYLSPAALGALVDSVVASLAPGGTVLVCHWRHPVPAYLQTGDAVHALIASRIGLRRLVTHLEHDFTLDVYSADSRSVAVREGLAHE